MILPEETVRRLQPLFPTLNLRSIEFVIAEPLRIASCSCCPHAVVKGGSSPMPGLVYVHPRFWAPQTLPGLKLIAHELYHQAQQLNPAFNQLYLEFAEEIERQGLPPWQHPLEVPAYKMEEVISLRGDIWP